MAGHRAFPSWFMRITCDRCGKDRMLSETHSAQGDMLIRDIIARMHGRVTRRRGPGRSAGDRSGRLIGTIQLIERTKVPFSYRLGSIYAALHAGSEDGE
jgi:hypothetical protein